MQSTGQTSTQALSFVPMHGSQMIYATLAPYSEVSLTSPDSAVSSRPDSQPRSITRRLTGVATAAALLLVCTDLRSAEPWRAAPEYVDLFAPRAHREAYRAYISPVGLDATLQALLADPAILRPPGSWEPEAQIPYDAFGLSGSYNRWKVAGLYRSRRARVVRGPRLDQGQLESWTLITPYPDLGLQRLEPGTLILVLRIPPAELP
jgi:hypothetical protein